jgi:protein involved in polysaccharide export with SLBB domain
VAMKTAVLIAATLLFGPVLRSQDLSLVEPGDILVLKFLRVNVGGVGLTKIIQVTPEGTISLPSVDGTRPPDLSVQGLSMNEVAEHVRQDYADLWRESKLWKPHFKDVSAERGTVAQLLEQ